LNNGKESKTKNTTKGYAQTKTESDAEGKAESNT
jgi:hypothetical protein